MKKLSFISRSALIATAASSLLISTAFAQQDSSTTSFGIEVSSPVYEYSLEPNTVQQDIIKIKNVGSDKATYYPEIVDFTSNNVDGAPKFLEEEGSSKYSLKQWVSISKESITIDPGKSEALNFFINVPAGAEPGGHYAAILFGTEPVPVGGSGAALKSKVGSLLLVRIAGDIKESAAIKEFKTDKTNYSSANEKDEDGKVKGVEFNLTIENSGNVHVQPKGTIVIKNIFGGQVATVDVNQLSANVLPGSTRIFNASWSDPGFKLGLYTATVVLNYGDPAQSINASTSFWIIPWMTLLVALLVIILLIALLIFAIKKYNSWIISRATKKDSPS